MHFRGLTAVLLLLGLVAAGCGWSPPAGPPPKPDTCAGSDGPSDATVQKAITALPPAPGGTAWRDVSQGHTPNCRLYWVQVSGGTDPAAPQQVPFFDRNTPLGTATPEPRPYTNVLAYGDDTVTVQYQWRQGNEAPCCPTGIGTVRFQIGQDGKLKALDPIPKP
jgi:hypothetical protein